MQEALEALNKQQRRTLYEAMEAAELFSFHFIAHSRPPPS
jgi:hypothetical protein